jgi:hypothetical protein
MTLYRVRDGVCLRRGASDRLEIPASSRRTFRPRDRLEDGNHFIDCPLLVIAVVLSSSSSSSATTATAFSSSTPLPCCHRCRLNRRRDIRPPSRSNASSDVRICCTRNCRRRTYRPGRGTGTTRFDGMRFTFCFTCHGRYQTSSSRNFYGQMHLALRSDKFRRDS